MSTDYDLREDTLAAFSVLMGLMVRLIHSKSGEQIQPGDGWRNDGQRLAIKLFQHCVTLETMSRGATVEFKGGEQIAFIDHGSMNVVARAALETFLVWHYLYATGDANLGRFRHATWKLSGLLDRQGFAGVSDMAAEVKRRERPEIERLTEEVKGSPYFSALTAKQQKRVLAGDWKIVMGTADMAKAAGLHDRYFGNLYDYACAYSHSSYLSALQIGQGSSIRDQHRMATAVMGVAVLTLAYFVSSYPKQFPEAQQIVDADLLGKATAEKWALKTEDMAAFFGATG